jgi:hypothetical protein
MQRIGGDHSLIRKGGALQPSGELVGEQHVGELGLAVRPCPGVGLLALKVVEVDAALGLCIGGDRDYPRRGALLQPIDEQVGEQERCEVVEGKGEL